MRPISGAEPPDASHRTRRAGNLRTSRRTPFKTIFNLSSGRLDDRVATAFRSTAMQSLR